MKRTKEEKERSKAAISALEEALDALTPKQLRYWEIMQKGELTQAQAYKLAFDTNPNISQADLQTRASKLWNNPKFKLCRSALMDGITSQTLKTKEQRVAEMQAFAERAEANGQYGASGKARELVGKLEGHYVDKVENVNKTRDQLQSLKKIAESLGEDKALELAKQVGMEDQLTEFLSTLH